MANPGRPKIYNLELASADTEYALVLADNTFKFTLKSRNGASLKLAYTSGESGTNYISIPVGITYWEDEINILRSLYLQSPTPGTIVEVVAWEGA
jgi:hypothetical protein